MYGRSAGLARPISERRRSGDSSEDANAPAIRFTTLETLPSGAEVHVVGAGPVGLLLTALLQSMEGFSVRLYEKRREYTRTRMVQLASYLVADSVESYRTDYIDGESVEAVFDPRSSTRASRSDSPFLRT